VNPASATTVGETAGDGDGVSPTVGEGVGDDSVVGVGATVDVAPGVVACVVTGDIAAVGALDEGAGLLLVIKNATPVPLISTIARQIHAIRTTVLPDCFVGGVILLGIT
jgi:hypothetical protein